MTSEPVTDPPEDASTMPATKRAADLVAGDRIDLKPVWTEDRDPFLHTYANAKVGTVASTGRSPVGSVVITLTDAPARVYVPADYEFLVAD